MLKSSSLLMGVVLGVMSASAVAADGWSYRAVLRQDGAAVDRPVDLEFTLWNSPRGHEDALRVGLPQLAHDVPVVDGLIQVELNPAGEFGRHAARASARWLQVAVDGVVIPARHTVNTSRNGISLRAGDQIVASTRNGVLSLRAIDVESRHALPTTPGGAIRATSDELHGGALHATGGERGRTAGVIGESLSEVGVGVHGRAAGAAGVNFGVIGQTRSPNGYAGYFVGGRNYFQGNVGIGTSIPSQRLEVIGNICATGRIGACSDARFKDNIEPLADPLGTLAMLCGVSFDWKQDVFGQRQFTPDRQIGFIAQEVGTVLPEVVLTNDDGTYAVDYGRLTPVLVEGLKQLYAAVMAKDDQLARQSEQLSLLAERLDEVQSQLASSE